MNSTQSTPRFPPLLVLAIGILAVSTSSIFIRFAQGEAPSLVVAAARLGISTIILTPLAITRYTTEIKALKRNDLLMALVSGILLAIHFATWITSLEHTTVTSSVVIVTTTPLWVALIAPFALREPLTKPVFIGLAFALLGGILIAFNETCALSSTGLNCQYENIGFQGNLFGNFLALLGAFSGAGYMLIGRKLRPRLSLIPYIFIVYGIAAICLILATLFMGQTFLGFSKQIYIWLILLALVPQLLGHSSFNWSLGYLPASFVSIALLGEPIGTSILAFIFLKESPTGLEFLGASMILFGIFLSSRQPQQQS